MKCPICSGTKKLKSVDYSQAKGYICCSKCDFIFWSINNTLDSSHEYGAEYWQMELNSAYERSWGISIQRASEVFLLCRKKISTFVDIGTGAGYFLDAIDYYIPNSTVQFTGIELYPPALEFRSKHPGYAIGWLEKYENESIDAGICVEVLEHLTADQVASLFHDLYLKASNDAFFIFNTGLTNYVRNEDPDYLDPYTRGHISIWSTKAIRELLGDSGWKIHEFPHRSWAFIAEKSVNNQIDLDSRIWDINPQNLETLTGELKSNLLYLLARDGLRAR